MEITVDHIRNTFSIFVACIVIFFIIPSFFKEEDDLQGLLGNMLIKDYHGIIEHKFIDYDNHATRTIVLERGSNVTLNSEFYKLVEVGDSISKKKGDHLIWLYKKQDTLNFDYIKWIEDIRKIRRMNK